jgi:hypothetical protein
MITDANFSTATARSQPANPRYALGVRDNRSVYEDEQLFRCGIEDVASQTPQGRCSINLQRFLG